LLEVLRREPHPGSDLARRAPDRISTPSAKLILERAILLVHRDRIIRPGDLAEASLELGQPILHIEDMARSLEDKRKQRLVRLDGDFLGQVTDRCAFRDINLTIIGLFFTDDDAEKRRFSDTIGAHEPDPLSG
jgi:hypothetical protein